MKVLELTLSKGFLALFNCQTRVIDRNTRRVKRKTQELMAMSTTRMTFARFMFRTSHIRCKFKLSS
mgnify:FL=1